MPRAWKPGATADLWEEFTEFAWAAASVAMMFHRETDASKVAWRPRPATASRGG